MEEDYWMLVPITPSNSLKLGGFCLFSVFKLTKILGIKICLIFPWGLLYIDFIGNIVRMGIRKPVTHKHNCTSVAVLFFLGHRARHSLKAASFIHLVIVLLFFLRFFGLFVVWVFLHVGYTPCVKYAINCLQDALIKGSPL